jgi:hypothetical protein
MLSMDRRARRRVYPIPRPSVDKPAKTVDNHPFPVDKPLENGGEARNFYVRTSPGCGKKPAFCGWAVKSRSKAAARCGENRPGEPKTEQNLWITGQNRWITRTACGESGEKQPHSDAGLWIHTNISVENAVEKGRRERRRLWKTRAIWWRNRDFLWKDLWTNPGRGGRSCGSTGPPLWITRGAPVDNHRAGCRGGPWRKAGGRARRLAPGLANVDNWPKTVDNWVRMWKIRANWALWRPIWLPEVEIARLRSKRPLRAGAPAGSTGVRTRVRTKGREKASNRIN